MSRPSRCFARIACLLTAILLTGAANGASLSAVVEYESARTNLGGATVAVSVRDADTGRELVDLRSGALMIPASNHKLLTTGAALATLGPDFRFQTKLLLDGDRLVIVGAGDPGFGDPELLALMRPDGDPDAAGMGVESFLAVWADAVAENIDRVGERVGEIVVDDRIFDREFVHDSWPADQINRRYCAQVSGLSFHLNVLHFFPQPRAGKRPALSHLVPAIRTIQIENNATSKQGVHENDTVWIARPAGTNRLAFYGNVKHRYRTPVPVTVHDMPALFGEILAERLRERGVRVGGTRTATLGEPDSQGTLIGPIISTPIATALRRCNRDSQNLYAECLLKRMAHDLTGQPGSWPTGAAIIRHAMHDRLNRNAPSAQLVIADGSGLSRLNRISPATMTAWLGTFHDDEALGATFIDSLSVAGSNGTLRKRLGRAAEAGALVQAKSGYINGVSCLSGYVTAPDGDRRCFSIMINDLRAPVSRAKDLQDRIVMAIVDDMNIVIEPERRVEAGTGASTTTE